MGGGTRKWEGVSIPAPVVWVLGVTTDWRTQVTEVSIGPSSTTFGYLDKPVEFKLLLAVTSQRAARGRRRAAAPAPCGPGGPAPRHAPPRGPGASTAPNASTGQTQGSVSHA